MAKAGKKPKKPKKKKPPKEEKAAKKPEKKAETTKRGIVRIAGRDMRGELPLSRALLSVRGFGHTLSKIVSMIIEKKLGFKPTMKVGDLSDEDIGKIDKVLYAVQEQGIPKHVLNRRGDFESGNDMHVIMNDLAFAVSQDVDREKKLYTWKGYRHAYGQKVRGQRTRNTGRKGMALGVMRKAILAQQKGAAKEGGKEKK
jgi:small subunit ribosomal protein S13